VCWRNGKYREYAQQQAPDGTSATVITSAIAAISAISAIATTSAIAALLASLILPLLYRLSQCALRLFIRLLQRNGA
jgi:hypothetical protein